MKSRLIKHKFHIKITVLLLVIAIVIPVLSVFGPVGQFTATLSAAPTFTADDIKSNYTPTGNNDRLMEAMMNTDLKKKFNDPATSDWEKHLIERWQQQRNELSQSDVWKDNASLPSNVWPWTGVEANSTSGTTSTNRARIPVTSTSGGRRTWSVYSVEQLLYAMNRLQDSDQIYVCRDLNFNGNSHGWNAIVGSGWLAGNKGNINNIKIEGRNGNQQRQPVTFYNFGSRGITQAEANQLAAQYSNGRTPMNGPKTSFEEGYNAGFVVSHSWQFSGITFQNAKVVGRGNTVGIINWSLYDSSWLSTTPSFTDVHCLDSMIFGGLCWGVTSDDSAMPNAPERYEFSPMVAFLGGWADSYVGDSSFTYRTLNRCSTQRLYTFGGDHVSSLVSMIDSSTITNSFSVDSLVVSTLSHSGGLVSCSNRHLKMENCFTNNEVYGNKDTGYLLALWSKMPNSRNVIAPARWKAFTAWADLSGSPVQSVLLQWTQYLQTVIPLPLWACRLATNIWAGLQV